MGAVLPSEVRELVSVGCRMLGTKTSVSKGFLTWDFPPPGLGGMPSSETITGLNLPVIDRAHQEGSVNMPTKLSSSSSSTSAGVPAGDEIAPDPLKPPVDDSKVTSQQFSMGDGLPPVPAKVVEKILSGQFVDMAELLRDNMEVERRRNTMEYTTAGPAPTARPVRREVPDLLSWVQCFGMFASVMASKFPEKVTQLLAYQTIIIREARRCGGGGWQGYDRMFRQQAVSSPGLDWSQLNSSLFAVTFLAQQNGRGKTCRFCLETDHVDEECALAPTAPQPRQLMPSQGPQGSLSHQDLSLREGRSGRGSSRGVCYAWNEGRCTYPYCRFRHICAKCYGDHRAVRCRMRAAGDRPTQR